MHSDTNPRRPGLTAIAAVLALSSTAAVAQAVEPSASAPVTIVPPTQPAPAVSTPNTDAVPTTDSATPVLSAAAPDATPAVASGNAAPMATASHPVFHTEAATEDSSTPLPRVKSVVPKAASTKSANPSPAVKTAPTQAVADNDADTATANAAEAPMTPTAPAALPLTDAKSLSQPEEAPAAASQMRAGGQDETLEIVGGLAILALAGGSFALYRRKRQRDEEKADDLIADMPIVSEESLTSPAMAFAAARPATAAPVTNFGENRLPEGFDLSLFGPHVQSAYRGPTRDNPSLSLKTRLKRARFYDLRDRQAGQTPVPTPATVQAAAPATAPARSDEQIVYRPSRVAKGGLKARFQSVPS